MWIALIQTKTDTLSLEFWVLQGGFALAAFILGYIALALWKKLNAQEEAHKQDIKDMRSAHQAREELFDHCLQSSNDNILSLANSVVESTQQSTLAIKEFKEMLRIYEILESLRDRAKGDVPKERA